ncbi:phosphatase PAP2 family protein [Pseudomonas sp. ABC1]|uniref:phosphatase PAP2 family protein n=1 Tax=Pseudomonas sp. ABC1 TaxID=2748080 RepID=UPI0015C3D619|nr:phosphatase PAP2 family protein [Pseudomonas sp. ABC1]QLF93194.1 phosphatase PAP2 family protein [Pseudomonas sp. ABC1]
MSAFSPQARWRVKSLLFCHVAALVLMASWVWAPGRAVWDAMDAAVFHLLNGSLGHLALWDWLWALTSTRVFDILVGAVLLVLLIHTGAVFDERQVRPALFTFLALLSVLLVIRVLFDRMAVPMGWQHVSPSLAFEDAYHLSDHFPLLERVFELKDRSRRSFPGDHASVLLLWGLFMALFTQGRWRALVLGLATLFMLPRLVAGAHWLSDDLVGGLVIAVLALGWGYCTPLGSQIARLLAFLAQPFLYLGAQLPWLRRLALFRQPPL